MRKLFFILILVISNYAHAYSEQGFTILRVGASNYTNTVFIDVKEVVSNTNCTNPKHFKLPVSDQLADKFYAAAISQHKHKIKHSLLVMSLIIA